MGNISEKFMQDFADRLRGVAMDAWEESKHRRAKDGRFGTKEGEHGRAADNPTKEGLEPKNDEPNKEEAKTVGGDGGVGEKGGYGDDWKKLFHQTKARKEYDKWKSHFDEAMKRKDITGMSLAMEQIDKLLTDPSNEGTQWKDEEWTPRDKSGDKIADDGTIMKNGVALDKTFQDGGTTSKYRLARNKWVKQLISSDDGTFDLETGKPVKYDNGFQVAFQTTASEKEGGMSDEEYDRIVDEVVKQTGAKPELGCFEVPEISFHFENRLQALEMMTKFNQHSIWNWGKFRIVMNKKLDTSTNDVKQGEIAKAGEAEKGDK